MKRHHRLWERIVSDEASESCWDPAYPAHPIYIPGTPTHPIYYPPGIWGGGNEPFPTPPIVIPPGSPGVPTHPIYYPPGIWGPTDPRPGYGLPGQPPGTWGGAGEPFPTPPIHLPPVGGGSPPRPTHPIILPGVPTHPIILPGHPAHPIILPGDPTHPIVLPPDSPPIDPPIDPEPEPQDGYFVAAPGSDHVFVVGSTPEEVAETYGKTMGLPVGSEVVVATEIQTFIVTVEPAE